jgi:uncharacterized membrane protein
MKIILLALLLAYAGLSHLAASLGNDVLACVALLFFVTLLVLPRLRSGLQRGIFLIVLTILGYFSIQHARTLSVLIYMPPVLINFTGAWLFGRTLRQGRKPLLEQLVRLLHQKEPHLVDDAVIRYVRSLTAAWMMLFMVMGVISIGLALNASPAVWSWFTNVVNYLVVALFFLLEYLYRQRRFPQQPYRNFWDFMRRSAQSSQQLFHNQRF